ncbi:MAG: hypothetical protein V4529_17260 [Gemmatimonadota bacterium]
MLFRGVFGGGAASGKSGSVVASHNSGGQYLRARTTPTNPRSVFQDAVRNGLRFLARFWSTGLSDAQRTNWNTYGQTVGSTNRLGDAIKISGIAAFQRANVSRLQASVSRVDDAPPLVGAPAPFLAGSTFSFSGTEGTFTLAGTLPVPGSNSNSHFFAYVTPPFSPGRSFPPQNTRLAFTLAGNATGGPHAFALPFASADSLQQMQISITYSASDGGLAGPFTFPGN